MQIALIGWQPGAFKLIACDGCMGWSAEQRLRRLHLIANSSRFVILTPLGRRIWSRGCWDRGAKPVSAVLEG